MRRLWANDSRARVQVRSSTAGVEETVTQEVHTYLSDRLEDLGHDVVLQSEKRGFMTHLITQ